MGDADVLAVCHSASSFYMNNDINRYLTLDLRSSRHVDIGQRVGASRYGLLPEQERVGDRFSWLSGLSGRLIAKYILVCLFCDVLLLDSKA